MKDSPVSIPLSKAVLPPTVCLTCQIAAPKLVTASQEVYDETPEDFEGIASALDAELHMVLRLSVKVQGSGATLTSC